MQRPKGLTIGRLAKGAGVGVQTIRFYERKGLLVQPPRHGPEYRQYTADHVTRIRFIQKAQGLGFSLKEIKGLMELGSTRRATCADVMKKTDRKLQEVRSKIRDLQRVGSTRAPISNDTREVFSFSTSDQYAKKLLATVGRDKAIPALSTRTAT